MTHARTELMLVGINGGRDTASASAKWMTFLLPPERSFSICLTVGAKHNVIPTFFLTIPFYSIPAGCWWWKRHDESLRNIDLA